MTNYEYVKAVEPSEKSLNIINKAVDDMCVSERSEERRVGKECIYRWSPYN